MITLYGKKYAKNEKEFTETLFQKDGTANGFYKKSNGGLVLIDIHGIERAFIRRDGLGPVTVTRHGPSLRFQNAASLPDEEWLGAPQSYSEKTNGAKALAQEIFQE
jgi:hypothetical protein